MGAGAYRTPTFLFPEYDDLAEELDQAPPGLLSSLKNTQKAHATYQKRRADYVAQTENISCPLERAQAMLNLAQHERAVHQEALKREAPSAQIFLPRSPRNRWLHRAVPVVATVLFQAFMTYALYKGVTSPMFAFTDQEKILLVLGYWSLIPANLLGIATYIGAFSYITGGNSLNRRVRSAERALERAQKESARQMESAGDNCLLKKNAHRNFLNLLKKLQQQRFSSLRKLKYQNTEILLLSLHLQLSRVLLFQLRKR